MACKSFFLLNHLCIFAEHDNPPAWVHGNDDGKESGQAVMVKYRDPSTGLWQGPVEVKYFGRGYMCVLTPTGPRWIPSKWVKAMPSEQKDEICEVTGDGENA